VAEAREQFRNREEWECLPLEAGTREVVKRTDRTDSMRDEVNYSVSIRDSATAKCN
jgi:hypothetical protein